MVGLQTNLTPRVPLLVYVFADADAFARFRPQPGFDGFLLPRAHRNFLVVQADGETDAGSLALHEYVHFVLRNGGATRYPAWYDEGLAEFLSTVSLQDGQVVIGAIPPGHERWLLYGSPMSLRQMMTAEDVYADSPQLAATLLRASVDAHTLLPRGRPRRLSEAPRAADGFHRPLEPR